MRTFEQWWDHVGSGIIPRANDDFESHAQRVAKRCFQDFEMQKELDQEHHNEHKEWRECL